MKQVILLVLLYFLTFTGCKKIDQLTHFFMNYTTTAIIEPSSIYGNPFDIYTTEINTNSDSIFTTQNTNSDNINLIQLKKLAVYIVNADSIPIGYIQSLDLYIVDPLEGDKQIAWSENSSTTDSLFLFTLTTDNLAQYLSEDKITYRLHGTLSQDNFHKTIFSVNTSYFTDAVLK